MACLTLVAPSGMTAEDRQAWVAVAKATLTGIPADLLARGCKKARETCRFASEIVPTIMDATRGSWELRKQMALEAELRARPRRLTQEVKPEYIGALQISGLIKSLGRPE